MLAARATPLGGHGAHLLILAAWAGVVVGVLVVDHLRGNRWRDSVADDDKPPSIDADHEMPVVPVRISMATWPPREVRPARPTRPRHTTRPLRRPWLIAAAIGSVIAAGVHVAVMPEHFGESYWYGTFFAVTAAMQLGYAALLVFRSSPTLLRAGIAGNGSVILLWAYTRLIGVPLGPGRGEVESVGALDVIATSAELLVLVACFVALAHLGHADELTPHRSPKARRALTTAHSK